MITDSEFFFNNICIHVSVIISSKTDEGVEVIIFCFEAGTVFW